jgi:hypothetical protein
MRIRIRNHGFNSKFHNRIQKKSLFNGLILYFANESHIFHLGLFLFVPGPLPGLLDGLVVLGPLLQVLGVVLLHPPARGTRHFRTNWCAYTTITKNSHF